MRRDSVSGRTVLVFADEMLASSLRAAASEAAPPFSVLAATTETEYRACRDTQQIDCIVSRTALPDADCPVVLYPATPESELARLSTGDRSVRYLPASTDTEDHALLVDAIEEGIENGVLVSEREHNAAERDLLAEISTLADVGGWEFDVAAETLTWTAETYRIHGLSNAFEPAVERAIEFYHPSDRDAVRDDFEAALAGETFDSKYRLYRADGEVRWVRSMGTPVYEDGAVVGIRGAFQDVTEQQEREDAIRQFKQAVESAGHAIFITERNGTITYVNPAFEEVTGYDAAEVIGRNPSLLKSGQMDQAYYSELWNTVLSGSVWSEPIVNERKSGEHYHASETIAPITTEDGTVEGFVAIQTDITEQVHIKERLETFREIVQRLDDPIMLQDESGAFEVVNDAVAEYAGLSKSDLHGRDEFAFMDDPSAQRVSKLKNRVMETEDTITYELDPTFPMKGQRSFVTTRYPHFDEDGVVDGTVAICRDVTEQTAREHQLRVLDRILRHNLYNKMNLILGHAELLESNTEGRASRSVAKIRETGEDLVALADKERRIVELLTDEADPVRIEVSECIDELIDDLRTSHPAAEIEVHTPPTAEVVAIRELREALAEVLTNAVIHSGAEPRVSVRVVHTGETVVIAVADDGPGIPEMEREAANGASGITPLFHGSGLGLQFVYHVAKRSGGTLRFASGDGGGDRGAWGYGTEADADADSPAGIDGLDGAVVILRLPAWEDTDGAVHVPTEE